MDKQRHTQSGGWHREGRVERYRDFRYRVTALPALVFRGSKAVRRNTIPTIGYGWAPPATLARQRPVVSCFSRTDGPHTGRRVDVRHALGRHHHQTTLEATVKCRQVTSCMWETTIRQDICPYVRQWIESQPEKRFLPPFFARVGWSTALHAGVIASS